MTVGLGPKSIAFVLGTRPELIKVAPLVKLFGDQARVVHTGQHYDEQLSGQFLAELGIGRPDLLLEIGGRSRGTQIGDATSRLEAAFSAAPPEVVVVHGDTNATVAGALAANATNIPLVHVEAGLRSFDRSMPEEHNRVVADHLADLCLAPTETNRANLAAEGIGGDKVMLTGNTVVDAVLSLLPSPVERAAVLARHDLDPAGYVLATFHRPENVDDPETLAVILSELGAVPLPVVLPLHPRTRSKIAAFGLEGLLKPLRVADPMGYREFLALCRRVGAAHIGLRRCAGGGQHHQAACAGRAQLDRAARDPRHVRSTRPAGTTDQHVGGAAARRRPRPPRPTVGDAVSVRRRDLRAALRGGDLDPPVKSVDEPPFRAATLTESAPCRRSPSLT